MAGAKVILRFGAQWEAGPPATSTDRGRRREPTAAGWGLLVWVSPWDFGGPSGVTGPALAGILADHRLIWVGAHRAGNERARVYRWGLALDAADQMARLYEIDPSRVYAVGRSGGGRAASALASLGLNSGLGIYLICTTTARRNREHGGEDSHADR